MYSLSMMDTSVCARRPAKGPLNRKLTIFLVGVARVCWLSWPVEAPGALEPGGVSAGTGPTLRLDCSHVPRADNSVADFMYFVPLISTEAVTATSSPKADHRVRMLSSTRRSKGATFQVTCEFEFTGNGYERNLFDYNREIHRHEAQLKQGRPLNHVLTAINVQGPGRATLEVEGTQTNGVQTVAEVRMRFNVHGQTSPVTIMLRDIRYSDGAYRTVNEDVARVNTLTFQRKAGPPKMEVSVGSVRPKDAEDTAWQNLKGNLKGMAVNLFIPPLPVDARGQQAMLDFGLALAAEAATFTFPYAENLVPPRRRQAP